MSAGRHNVMPLFPDHGKQEDAVASDPSELDASRLGRYAEFMVCAELTKLGYHVLHVDAPGFDLILTVDDSSWRVQVKSTTIVREGTCRWKAQIHQGATNGSKGKVRPSRTLSRQDADLLALFHHQFGTTVFIPIGQRRGGIIELPASQVQQHDSAQSLRAALRWLRRQGGGGA